MTDRLIRVLIVDDSAYVRKVLRLMLARSPELEVVGAARDGEEALELVEQLQPDVVTLDLTMPRMDGVTFLRTQMARRPLPVVVVSLTDEGGEQALAALDAGAVDFVQKPTALATEKIYEISDQLIATVRSAAGVRADRLHVSPVLTQPPLPAPPAHQGGVDIVVI
ncbi:MAG TPA: response regulator, partial [Chloroflexia bacterium]|nr:response regulator [Chloroflexia bacterium]